MIVTNELEANAVNNEPPMDLGDMETCPINGGLWVRCDTKLPEEEKVVVTYHADIDMIVMMYRRFGFWNYCNSGTTHNGKHITHWLDLNRSLD